MFIASQEGGAGPLVSLQMSASSGPTPLSEAPVDETILDTDLLLINRAGALQQVPAPSFVGADGPAMSGMQLAENGNDLIVDLSVNGTLVGTITVNGFVTTLFSSPVARQVLGAQIMANTSSEVNGDLINSGTFVEVVQS